jgi:hypothetical protein
MGTLWFILASLAAADGVPAPVVALPLAMAWLCGVTAWALRNACDCD